MACTDARASSSSAGAPGSGGVGHVSLSGNAGSPRARLSATMRIATARSFSAHAQARRESPLKMSSKNKSKGREESERCVSARLVLHTHRGRLRGCRPGAPGPQRASFFATVRCTQTCGQSSGVDLTQRTCRAHRSARDERHKRRVCGQKETCRTVPLRTAEARLFALLCIEVQHALVRLRSRVLFVEGASAQVLAKERMRTNDAGREWVTSA